ncbi:GIY-YIG nuclease family protein [Parahaliea mediterranea]|uniref:GIY-YIG nuclease family protein n=1 Tax=Parahaliea mediterranea TaxID=651086 RepID=A0A939DEC1_9GAMM|nr:GIY-YIG nuclease family protein [Parahaliea mediterranea]MBN7796331.1 GIY-YIG nuclease family protein [Parahaliea mediterranea]
MLDQHTIIYVMRHIDIGGHIDIPYKKVGITGRGNATLSSRLQQISTTKSPIQAQCIAAWTHDDAKAIETAFHLLLDDSRVEGEWFYDKDDTLVERLQPMMELLGAQEIEIESADDSYSKNILKREDDSRSASNQKLLGEISELLKTPLRTSIRKTGPTFFSDKTSLTYYIGYRKSGNHSLSIGRSKDVYESLSTFLETQGYDTEQHARGHALVHGLSVDMLADLINITESSFNTSFQLDGQIT